MNTNSYKTISANKATVKKEWLLVDAEGEILGRLASQVAKLIRGKHKPDFTPHVDCGDNVIIINAEKVKVTGNKLEQKKYYSHTGYPGGIKEKNLKELLEKKPEDVIKKAVWGMIPKNKLGRAVFSKLKVYRGSDHPHEAQTPQEYQF